MKNTQKISKSKYIATFGCFLVSIVSYIILFANIDYSFMSKEYTTLLSIDVVISALNIILFFTAILPAKIKAKMFKSTLDTKRYTLVILLLQALFSLAHAFFNFCFEAILNAFVSVNNINAIALPILLAGFYLFLLLTEYHECSKVPIYIFGSMYLILSVVVILNSQNIIPFLMLLPQIIFVIVFMYELSKISSISALMFFKSQTLEAENEEIDCYCFYAEMDGNKNLIYYFTDPETDKYYIYTQGAAKEITNNSAQSTDDKAQLAKNAHNNLIVLSHKIDKEIAKINNEYY
jgi:hypothetical protein